METQSSAGQEQKEGLLRQAWNAVEKFVEDDRKKWGGMTPGAMARLGLAELREAASPGGNVVQPTPLGMYGTLTPGEVDAAREPENLDLRRMEKEALPSPGRIAEGDAYGRGDRGPSSEAGLASPSEIADSQSRQQQDGQQQGRDTGRSRGRGM